ncbi:hypothetical protein HAX54_019052 [Datura stramonium]|uniref:Uncharacterized protein n=1 Tax=Datura stramonium TaxID=4076 RepID=A0ABS8S1U0_DATST|nr:hypothetical protein [Datura stramonium]
MQASTFTVKGNIGFGLQNRRIIQGVGDLHSRTLARQSIRMTERSSCFGVRMDSASMGIELGRARRTVQSVFGSSAKSRSHRVRASGEDIEDAAPLKVQGQSSASVLPYVGVACLGAILFGYHLGFDLFYTLVGLRLLMLGGGNGALEYLAKDLGIAENTVIQGWIVSTVLCLGFPLLVRLLVELWLINLVEQRHLYWMRFHLQLSVQAMIIGRLLTGIASWHSHLLLCHFTYLRSHPRKFAAHLEQSISYLFALEFCCTSGWITFVWKSFVVENNVWYSTYSICFTCTRNGIFSRKSSVVISKGEFLVETSIKRLYEKERVAEVMGDLEAASQGSSEPDAGWLDLFSSRYRKAVGLLIKLLSIIPLQCSGAGISSDVAASALVGAANVFGTTGGILFDGQTRTEESLAHKLYWNGCINDVTFLVIHLEGPDTIFWHTSCSWYCPLCVVLFTWCWSCACSSTSRDICFQN